MPRKLRALALVAATAVALPALAACGGGDDGPSITVYNAQHEQLITQIVPDFEKATGIKVKLRNGSDLELANQIVAEGKASPADVFLTENSPAMTLVDGAGLLTKVEPAALKPIPRQYVPADRDWTGFLARSTVLLYNTQKVQQADLPTSLLDLAKPAWKGRVAYAPNGADFQAIVSAVLQLEGEDATRTWLQGLKANGRVYDGNNSVLQAVNAGDVDAGITYHYYWARDRQENGENSDSSALHYFTDGDPGAFLSVSAAGVLASSSKQSDAQRFVEYLTSAQAQQAMGDSYALEYPLNPEASLPPEVKALDALQPPKVDLTQLNSSKVVDLMQQVGLL
ncbi:iron ABC transporter substrate-binding protein [Nocardioides sp. TRM66260-LWL]|uniref:iron ABC transporter substrate-binding protein n=1 Tax=Nocardioides sp. TRM66260-LWL TaxID=2874478 RepID=UPI001CC4A879|nr:iron ABC transporter substrate-binding protein [Nocardioides sp. TRM66260-LWL]MBZ5732975.1 iron ABC transporter substrate-binding protein [Nocardioides sp. TRM66260-LWL]